MSSHFLSSISADVLGIDKLLYNKLTDFFTAYDFYQNAFTTQSLRHSLDIPYSETEEIIKKLIELKKIRVISKGVCPSCLFEIQPSDLDEERCSWCNSELIEYDKQDYFELIESNEIFEELIQEPEIEYIYQYKPKFICKTKIDDRLREIYKIRTKKYGVLHREDMNIFTNREFVIYQSKSISVCLDEYFAYILFDKHRVYADYMREIPINENFKIITEIFTSDDLNDDFRNIIKHDHFPNLIDTIRNDIARNDLLDDAIKDMYISSKRKDYSPMVLPVFRIQETLLKHFLSNAGITVKNTFFQFTEDPVGSFLYVLQPKYIKNTTLKPAEIADLNDLYTLYKTRRHPLFHVEMLDPQGNIPDTLTHQYFSETYELVYAVLIKIEESCAIFK